MKLYVMTCGWLTMPAPTFLRGREGTMFIPVPSYLVEHPKGTVVFDTGLETTLQSNDPAAKERAIGRGLAKRVEATFAAGEELGARLRAFDRDPAKINYMVSSHLHFDHAGANEQLPNARWVLQKKEWEAANTPEGQKLHGYMAHHLNHGHDRLLVDGEYDIFGDGAVTLIPTHGHTPGHQSMRVKLPTGDVVLTGDACYFRQSLDEMFLPDARVIRDEAQFIASLETFKRLEKAGARLIFGHDPNQIPALTEGPAREVTF